jgi:hypothetical protein
MGRACSTNGEEMNSYRVLVGMREVKRHREDQDVDG